MTRASDLQAVTREGKRIRTGFLDVRVLASPLDHPRVGIVVPRHGHNAVERNRLKRQLREFVRLHLIPIVAGRGRDIVFRARAEAYAAEPNILKLEVESLGARL